ncbi:uncharacterized protein PGTG_22004 [Puccinia graminis f. sp. tritici CRL 75-36-700-3]|uniref:Uncharacterized protein n=1 Tax=Puccinia graminis f. sp. tritici (strain CRL 75-36-700-3 / race SCCL) TaxID=418459 RepID=H6QT86_PUCGT|nr:uncharacterized protein PGTG_22004 [Puccinia graminis f. sp. tritici CRL 75-36-700-3]EHS64040.1 hypothetical protein PGTG_22004 [Puccinia graminis f. sp. tritici CRL 75-36-700-3]
MAVDMMFHISRAAAPQQHLSQESRCNCLGCNMDEWKLQPNAPISTHASDSAKRCRKDSVSSQSIQYETNRNDEKRITQSGQLKENQNHLGSIKDTHGLRSTISGRISSPTLATRISHCNDEQRSGSSST